MPAPSAIPAVPAKHEGFIPYLAANAHKPLSELLEPYKQQDTKLREIFAQEHDHPALSDQHVNVVPVFTGHEKDVKIRARQLDRETEKEKDKYVMPLQGQDRKPNGAPAIVEDLKTFQRNFSIFSESALVDLDWSNVVVAGSAVVTSLLPVPKAHNKSKRELRKYYHEIVAPASDVDLFLYGMSEEEAVKKILQIEQCIKDSILTETTTVRTKNAVTIVSQYPTRHIQIVLRIYKSVSEILTGFDVDCSCAAYDGKQVYASPRAITAYMSQCNTIDLTRRSPSYENRLSKYSHRGFEVYWPLLDRSRIDPTIFERNFGRTLGLARLLVLEKLPKSEDRDAYMDQRRRERGRPEINRWNRDRNRLQGNIKQDHEDEVAEWVEQDEVSDYHTFTIPYGPKYHAKRIEKLLFTKDLLLNAEWNKPEDREVNLHRHPAFFGLAEDVIHDCCGYCPEPSTPEEEEVAEEEAKIYVSGELTFIKDDPGRQAIGSFNPINDQEWTEMAYVGNTASLMAAIVDGDLEHVKNWLSQEGADPNARDYTGRTPLHLAVTSSTPEIVQTLIDHGARLVARLADGRTALHLAAARGNVEMVKMILQKSEANEEEEAKKEDLKKQARITAKKETQKGEKKAETGKEDEAHEEEDDDDVEMVDAEDDDVDMKSATTSSFVKVQDDKAKADDMNAAPEDDEDDPDVYDVNVLAWDMACSPLHLAIVKGHVPVVRELVQTFGADVLLPVKLLNAYNKSPRGAILTLVLSLQLPLESAKEMTHILLELGSSCVQADMDQTTALHYISAEQPDLLDVLLEHDEPAAKKAVNHMRAAGSWYNPAVESPLMTAIKGRNAIAAFKLMEAGADPSIEFSAWVRYAAVASKDVENRDTERNKRDFLTNLDQPVILAVKADLPAVVLQLLDRGADPNTLTTEGQRAVTDEWYRRNYNRPQALLDLVRSKTKELKEYQVEEEPIPPKSLFKEGVDYLEGYEPGSYNHFIASLNVKSEEKRYNNLQKDYEEQLEGNKERKGVEEKKAAIRSLATSFDEVETKLLELGAKTWNALHEDLAKNTSSRDRSETVEKEEEGFKVEFSFNVRDLTEERRDAYIKLFEAAWSGDEDAIKSVTLGPWGPDNTETPLKIAVTDYSGLSPFSIAVMRGHHDLGKTILQIAQAQLKPDEKKKERHMLGQEEDDEYSDDDDASDRDLEIYSEVVNDQFTIENVGEIGTQVKSKTTPVTLLQWNCPVHKYLRYSGKENTQYSKFEDLFQYAIITDGTDLFKYLLDLQMEWGGHASLEDDSPSIPTLPQTYFDLAIEHGRLSILAEMIKRTGAGMALDSLVKQSGVKYEEKPKYYQGLSVHGKKRADWAAAARGASTKTIEHRNPPVLAAAFKGNVSSVQWFLSDIPAGHYKEFAEANRSDKRIQHLDQSAGGFDKILSTWLGARRELIVHCAVLSKPTARSTALLEDLLKFVPGSIDSKSAGGYTPLSLAFSLERISAARTLLAAGADQTVRDDNGNNILHLLLSSAFTNTPSSVDEELKLFLDLIDKRLVESLLTERSSEGVGAATPLCRWLDATYGGSGSYYNYDSNPESEDRLSTLKTILDFAEPTNNAHLELLNGAGDTPLHQAIKYQLPETARMMLDRRPELLYRENATGRTPAEMAEDAYIANAVKDPPTLPILRDHESVMHKGTSEFGEDAEPTDSRPRAEMMWSLCKEYLEKHPGKRKLVSLLDANEVAKRLAWRQSQRVTTDPVGENDSSAGEQEAKDTGDEVATWYYQAAQWGEEEEEEEEEEEDGAKGKPAENAPESMQDLQMRLAALEQLNKQRILASR